MPTVSVILPSFNRVRFLEPAVASVLAQTYADWELLIADDGSGEETRSYLRGLKDSRVRVLWLDHCGNPSKVRNAAIREARGRYVAFLDSDDLWAPAKLERQVNALNAEGSWRWSYTLHQHVDEQGVALPRRRGPSAIVEGWIFEPLLELRMAIPMPALLAERALVNEVGAFDEQQRFGEFHDLCLRLALESEVLAVHERLCSIRRHDEHYSADRVAANLSWLRLYDKIAARTRDPRIVSLCKRMQAQTSRRLARAYWRAGKYGSAWLAVVGARVHESA